jgi:hypothetical protein
MGAWPERLSSRYEAIVESNRDRLRDARVLDLASHDGRWSLAALEAGAAHVTGIEARADLVRVAIDNMKYYGISDDRFSFSKKDINHLVKSKDRYDVVMCLGYFYHTLNHMALFQYISSTTAEYLILDGMVEPGEERVVRIYDEDISAHANGISDMGIRNGRILVGHPSAPVLGLMLDHVGYDCTFYDWHRLIERRGLSYDLVRPHGPDNPVGDYARRARVTAFANRRN